MAKQRHHFTSESVSEGHPDKVCDRISDAILDAFLGADPYSRVAVEALATSNLVVLAGEVRGPDTMTGERMEEIARRVIREIGYEQEEFDWRTLNVCCRVHQQSADIAQGVDAAGDKDEGAGDQGLMFGYACRETDVLMPAAIHYSHRILFELAKARHGGETRLGPDAKSQITLLYDNDRPVRTTSIVVSTQHRDDQSQDEVRELVRPVVERVLPEGWMCPEEEFYVNPTGKFVIGGPHGDCGLTGRKIIVDTYGGAAPHGGGAFSGKDPTKVDRSAAYAARYLAKNVVAADLADTCLIQLAYAIGVAKPLSVLVRLDHRAKTKPDRLAAALREVMDLSPRGIREHLGLNRPIYERTSAYGHFGRAPEADGGFSWERTDLVEPIRAALS